ncbi:hypothetical protein D3C77_375240 [compost metagenome]
MISEVNHPARFLPLLSRIVSKLGERFGVPYTHTNRHARLVPYALLDALADGCEVALHASQVSPALIDAVLLDVGHAAMNATHDFVRHVAIQRVVARKRLHALLLKLVTDFEERSAHRDIQGFSFACASDDAAVVVAEHDDGHCR